MLVEQAVQRLISGATTGQWLSLSSQTPRRAVERAQRAASYHPRQTWRMSQ